MSIRNQGVLLEPQSSPKTLPVLRIILPLALNQRSKLCFIRRWIIRQINAAMEACSGSCNSV